MRLSQQQQSAIRSAVAETFGETASVWLFGSRVDDNKRGGDIDLLVCPEGGAEVRSFARKMALLVKLERALGERKIDVVGEALRDALQDMGQRKLTCHEYEHLSKEDRRLLDQFADRFTRLQDDMGTRLMPTALRAMGEEISAMPEKPAARLIFPRASRYTNFVIHEKGRCHDQCHHHR
jgi:predicted nucleotidyltransferase